MSAIRHALRARAENTVIVVQARFYVISLAAAVIGRLHRVPVLVVEHGACHLSFAQPQLDRVVAAWEHFGASLLRRLGVTFAAVSAAAGTWLRHFGAESSVIIPNGIERVAATSNVARSRAILFIGRDIPQKGLPLLLEAFDAFHKDNLGWSLEIAGVRDAAGIAPRRRGVRFLGELSHEEIGARLEACSMLVMPSIAPEGFPTVLLEAGQHGTPVISTPMGGAVELIEHRITGLIAQPNASALCAAMNSMALDAEFATSMGAALRERVRTHYEWRIIADKLVSFVTRRFGLE